MEKDLNMCILLDVYGALITRKQYEVMDYYYNQDLSLAEISEHLNITRQGVRDSIKRAEQEIRCFEEKLKLYEKYVLNKAKTEKIKELLSSVEELNQAQIKNELLQSYIEEITRIIGEINV